MLKGYISRRDEDGTWYLQDAIEQVWTNSKSEGDHTIGPDLAARLMVAYEDAGHYFVRYTASIVKKV